MTLFVSGVSESTVCRIAQIGSDNDGKFSFKSITPEDWKSCCEHIKKIEKEYYDRGMTLYSDVDELVIQLGEDSSDDELDSESSNDSVAKRHGINVGASTSQFEGVEYLDFDSLE